MLTKSRYAGAAEQASKPWTAESTVERAAGHKNMQQLIQLRWIAVIGQLTTIEVVTYGFGIELPLQNMLIVLACLAAFNGVSELRWRMQKPVTNNELFLALLVDVGSLTAQLYFSGGLTNPFAFLYLLQVILSAVLLEAWSTWTIVAITSACLAGLALFSKPLILPANNEHPIFSLYVQGVLICFMLNAGLLVASITRISANLRAGDAMLANLRQQAAEEEHIVRMGLLASGAAHELGTPLATLSVILGDWRRMKEFKSNPELLEEITEMETQLKRCKSIVSGILLSAGETRGESSTKTTIATFLDDIAREWRATRPIQTFVYENRIEDDMPVVFDSALKQTVYNLLDNAIEASPHWLSMIARREGDSLVLMVSDDGPGFAPEMLAQFGKPYQSTKGRPGGGLGIFLAVNVSRTLGGMLTARNRAEGGAVVQLTLPLSRIALPEEEKHVSR
ncbi:two-component system, sensor histidine kinase RegB [Noviherbaspirillum humi]|uniref:histidine kinase n=1 Tax=Noviherbaspirillum humi TaxID=1688639 RepID=A0A239DRS7_9BURK|nr:ATP-binding protein [Noviherbaspirillum humi]SNS34443.1 two-component system, sensor histidine kinase RegB [Noviherbaspirillum humi]